MKTKSSLLIYFLLSVSFILYSQEWEQTATTPEGGGVTEILVHPENDYIFVTTASYDYPYGDDGGIRRSMDDGDTWENSFDAYNGRTITYAADGKLYASVWPYPAHEGLYRSTDDGDNWDLLSMIEYGNNIFSITVNIYSDPTSIFIGTREGVRRSIDDGETFSEVNEGIPWATWVHDIEVDPNGIIVAATTSGLFSSEDNGDTWEQASGDDIENDTITRLVFDYPITKKDNTTKLLAGSNKGNIYESFDGSRYLVATLGAVFSGNEISGVFFSYLESENEKMHGVAQFPKGTQPGGGFSYSVDFGTAWNFHNLGIPYTNIPASSLSGKTTSTDIDLKMGLFLNNNGGAQVFKISFKLSTLFGIDDHQGKNPVNFNFSINPNPCSNLTTLQYELHDAGNMSFELINLSGEKIESIDLGKKEPGIHQLELDLTYLKRGVYFCILKNLSGMQTKKMIKL